VQFATGWALEVSMKLSVETNIAGVTDVATGRLRWQSQCLTACNPRPTMVASYLILLLRRLRRRSGYAATNAAKRLQSGAYRLTARAASMSSSHDFRAGVRGRGWDMKCLTSCRRLIQDRILDARRGAIVAIM